MNVRILIVTIVKDDLNGLIRTIESVNNQEYKLKYHFLVIADLDTATKRYLEELHTQISWVSNIDTGLYDAMNKWSHFKEDFELICWLNAGDVFSDVRSLSYVVDDFKNKRWNWFFGNMIMANQQGKVIATHIQTPYRKILLELGIRWVPFPSTFFTRNFIEKIGLYRTDLGVGSDQEFMIRAAQLSPPSTTHKVLSRMTAGGAHSFLTGIRRERDWQEFRKVNGVYFLRSRILDTCILPILVVTRKFSRHKLARIGGVEKRFLKKWGILDTSSKNQQD